MKKLLIILVFGFPFPVYAQVRPGVRGGVDLSTIGFRDYKPEKRMLAGVNAGTLLEIPVIRKWSIQTGPYYSGKGVIFGRSYSTNKIDSFTIILNYIELPAMMGYSFFAGNNGLVTISGGPYASYGFNGKIKQRTDPSHSIHLHKKEGQYKRLDAGCIISVQYETKNNYGARLDLSRSLISISRDDKQRNAVLSFSLFWYIIPKLYKGPGGTPGF